MKVPIIAGNWKMNKTIGESVSFVHELRKLVGALTDRICVVCPPFISLAHVCEVAVGSSIHVGAQDVFWESDGAYTGEISPRMIKDAGAVYVIVGHSERRAILSETDAMVNRKVKKALSGSLTPIICVGETLQEREKGMTFEVVKGQTIAAFSDLTPQEAAGCVIAYEPVWAIGTGRNATPQQAQEVHAFIRGVIGEKYGRELADALCIQYGGSVKPDNIDALMKQEDIDGALVGGASLDVKSFARIVQFQ